MPAHPVGYLMESIVSTLEREPMLTAHDLQQRFAVSTSTMHGALQRLLRLGMVRRKPLKINRGRYTGTPPYLYALPGGR